MSDKDKPFEWEWREGGLGHKVGYGITFGKHKVAIPAGYIVDILNALQEMATSPNQEEQLAPSLVSIAELVFRTIPGLLDPQPPDH